MNGYYINLEHRKDRNKHFINNIKKYDFFKNLERYEGIYDKDYGEIGCVKSHIHVLELCLEQNDDYYLIMEDDFDIFHEKNINKFFNSFNKIKNKEWDIITLTPSGTFLYEDKIEDFYRIQRSLTTTGYIIKRNAILKLINNFKESCKLLKETKNKYKYKLDVYWFKIQTELKFYYFKDIFGRQLNGFSDISKKIENQSDFFINKKDLLNQLLIALINEPYNDMNNFNLAFEYENIGQTASALSYYLRCAEFTKNKDLSYECLLKMSKCLSKQGNRDIKELVCIEHAISIEPNRPEAYYIISLYYSYRKNWLKSYMFACIGLENLSEKNLLKNIGYFDKYQLLFQKAYTGYNKGKINESKEIYFDLLNNHNINEYYKNVIENNLKQFPEPSHKPIQYKKDKYNKLKYKFINSEKIENNYSQIYQDLFVLSMYNGKKEGIYIEIGSGDPIYGNNTYLLEKDFNWFGISIDINKNSCNSFIEKRNNECLNVNALECNYENLLNKYGNIIDYLQLDCDPPNITYDILIKIPFDKIKFGVITYEHDYYNDKTKSYRQKSRKYLHNKGYKLIVGNISPDRNNNPFEDWWIHPDLIDESIYNNFIYEEVEYINGEDYMFRNDLLDNFSYKEVDYKSFKKISINKNIPEISINKNIPTALIIDNFYNNVDEVRNYALSLDYESEENHGAVGFRSESGRKIYNGTKEYFENLLNVKIQEGPAHGRGDKGGWDYSTNGCFQWCPKGTPLVYHCDNQNYAGIVYLTPDAPVNCGTSLLRHKKYKIKDDKIFELDDWHELIENKDNLFTDKSPWEKVDNFGNIYNRLVLFNSYNVHAVTEYFGDNIENSRLFQLFFFNVK